MYHLKQPLEEYRRMTVEDRKWHIKRWMKQKDFENEQAEAARKKK